MPFDEALDLKKEHSYVQLVNIHGNHNGIAEKISVHLTGQLHLAFSVLFYRKQQGKYVYLLQKRAATKYHSGGLWTNTCCSHPMPDEKVEDAAKRRLNEELGIRNDINFQNLKHIVYRAELDNNMIEHEYDMVLAAEVGHLDVALNPEEVSSIKWWEQSKIDAMLETHPQQFSAWFPLVYQRVKHHLNKQLETE